MLYSKLINQLLFDYLDLDLEEIKMLSKDFPPKILRWLGANHPDNRIRKIFFSHTNITIGEGTVINSNFIVSDDYEPLLFIGKRVAISPNVTVVCASGPNNSKLNDNEYVKANLIVKKKVSIEDDVWIGANVTILPGVTIGKGSVIGAGSIVSKNISREVVAVGNRIKEIRKI